MPESELDFPFDVPVREPARSDDAKTDAAAHAPEKTDAPEVTDAAATDAEAGAVEADAAEVVAEETAAAEAAVEVPAEPIDADDVLLASVELARAALLEDTPADTVGEPIGHIVEGEHVLSLLFECTMSGYPGWNWTVTLSRIDANSAPTVLETELMPGDESLLAPDWVPWSERLADYRAAQELASAQAATDALDTGDDEDGDGEHADSDDDDDTDDDIDGDEFGDDALDGIDFGEALAASELHPGEADEAEDEAEDGAPEPPAESGGGEGTGEDDDQDEGDKPRH